MSHLKSFDPASHAFIGGKLTDRQIDAYCLRGHYGPRIQKRYLNAVASGTFRSLDARIRKGEFGTLAQKALGQREGKRRTPSRKKKDQAKAYSSLSPELQAIVDSL